MWGWLGRHSRGRHWSVTLPEAGDRCEQPKLQSDCNGQNLAETVLNVHCFPVFKFGKSTLFLKLLS